MATVLFTQEREYVDEILRWVLHVENEIVRMERRETCIPEIGNAVAVKIIATAVVRGDILRLDAYCGEDWLVPGGPDTSGQEKAVLDVLDKLFDGTGLEKRLGIITDPASAEVRR